MSTTSEIDRLAMRTKPEGSPIMEQKWENILFLHWPVSEELIRPLIPAGLEIDTYNNSAWVGITPFRLSHLRLPSMPEIPGMNSFDEINVRTYVHWQGKPGIWFFSLDASKLLAAWGARIFFGLRYFTADIDFQETGKMFSFDMKRSLDADIYFKAKWETGERLRDPHVDSLAFFLAERYCLFTGKGENLYMSRIYHQPWILDQAILHYHQSTMLRSIGFSEPTGEPLTHFSRGVSVEVWPEVKL